MNLLITGGAGYVGHSLVENLLKNESGAHSIKIYDNLSRKNFGFFTGSDFRKMPVSLIHGDILDGRKLGKALDGIDCVVHLAARVTTPYADHDAHFFDQINHWGSASVARELESSAVKKCIYLSSIAVYGESHDMFPKPVNEETEPQPHTFYGISKLDGEKQFAPLEESIDLWTIRSANVYGFNPSFRTDAVVNRFMFNAHFLNNIQVMGSGEQWRSFLHVKKLATIIAGAINGNIPPGLYNAVEHNLKINDVVEHVRQLYPRIETINVNFNSEMRSIRTETPAKFSAHLQLSEVSLDQELRKFRESFSF